jgi:hypothetical protein
MRRRGGENAAAASPIFHTHEGRCPKTSLTPAHA